jgi:hypothetical protein
MTAMNVWTQPGAAYLLTDSAFYTPDGKILAFGEKMIDVTGDFRAAMAPTGALLPHWLIEAVSDIDADSFGQFLSFLPSVLRRLEKRAPGDTMAMAVIGFHEGAQEPSAYLLGNDHGAIPEPYVPYTVAEVAHHFSGCAHTAFDREVDFADPASFDPERDGLTLIEAQRRDPFEDVEGSPYRIGGHAILTRLDRGGITHKILREWPDVVGERIRPEAVEGPSAA